MAHPRGADIVVETLERLRSVDFMARTKAIRRGARDWRDLFFSNMHAKPGR